MERRRMNSAGSGGGWVRRAAAIGLVLAFAGCGGNPEGEPIRFTVPAGTGMAAITDTLEAREIVSWPLGFRAYARLRGVSRDVKPGVYEVRAGTAWSEILDKLVEGDVIEVS